MVFSSMVFLCIFLPIVFLLHQVLPGERSRNGMLLIAGVLFYAYGEPVYILLLIGSAAFNWAMALLIDRLAGSKKLLLAAAVTVNLLLLVIFKYAGFLTESANILFHINIPVPQIRLPIGISFYTFQAMSYVIDVYRGVDKAQKSWVKVLLYITFFPQLIAGPIVKYHDIAAEIDHRHASADDIHAGIRRFIIGLSKKVLIADTMAVAVDALYAASGQQLGAALAWLGAVSYLFQIYFDFSGYSDMAIGMGRMFGFHFRENFDHPYVSSSIKEFWRRWHISLSGWFKEYLYIPMGGNRKGKARTVFNKVFVFLCTGIWHGANLTYLFWGAYHGLFMLLEETFPGIAGKRKTFVGKVLQHAATLLVVLIGFVFFRAATMSQGCIVIREMFTGWHMTAASRSLLLMQLTPVYLVTLAAAVLFSMPHAWTAKISRGTEAGSGIADIAADILTMAALVLCMLSLASGTYHPFIYFQF